MQNKTETYFKPDPKPMTDYNRIDWADDEPAPWVQIFVFIGMIVAFVAVCFLPLVL